MLHGMKNRTSMHWVLAASLAVFSMSCGNTHALAPSRAEELAGFVLLIEEAADGQAHFSWKRASEFDLRGMSPAP
jgi:hypothetical protein